MLNQVILIGAVNKIKKVGGVVQSFHLDIERPIKGTYDSPSIQLPQALANATSEYIKQNAMVAVKAHIETVVRGGYGTVTAIVADRLTYLSSTKEI
jgi:hypothetical protein